ncbi:MAG: hypothetical protein AAFX99_25625, partial [Myxococcota bacterium]
PENVTEISWGYVFAAAVLSFISLIFFGIGGESRVLCTRPSEGAQAICVLTRSLLGATIGEERFPLATARVAEKRSSDGSTYRVELIDVDGGVHPRMSTWTNIRVESMHDDVDTLNAFMQDPSQRRVEVHDIGYIGTLVGLAFVVIVLFLLSFVLIEIGTLCRRWLVRQWRLWRLQRRIETDLSHHDQRPKAFTTVEPSKPTPNVWTDRLTSCPRHFKASLFWRLLWHVRRSVGTISLDTDSGSLEFNHKDTAQTLSLTTPFTVHLSARILSSEWLDLSVTLAREGALRSERMTFNARLPHRVVAADVELLDTHAPYIDSDLFMRRIWPAIVFYSQLHGRGLERKVWRSA